MKSTASSNRRRDAWRRVVALALGALVVGACSPGEDDDLAPAAPAAATGPGGATTPEPADAPSTGPTTGAPSAATPVEPGPETEPPIAGPPYTLQAVEHALGRLSATPVTNPAPGDAAALSQWRTSARSRLLASLGVPGEPADDVDLELQTLESVEFDAYTRQEISYFVERHLRTRAYLFVPQTEGPHPAIVFWHGHTLGGHRAAAGIEPWGEDNHHHAGAAALAAEGYVVLAPTIRTFDESASQRAHLHYERVMRMGPTPALGSFTSDALRAVDVLVGRDDVRRDSIGATGLSLGGLVTLLSVALDDRVTVGVVQSFFGSYRGALLTAEQCACQYAGALGRDFDLADVAIMAAPAALRIVAGVDDREFPIAGQRDAFSGVASAYAAAGSPDLAELVEHDGGHEWVAAPAIEWFATHLRGGDGD